jgi:hypothetical protein
MDNYNFYTQTEVDTMSHDFDHSAIKLVVSRTRTDRTVARYEKPRVKL